MVETDGYTIDGVLVSYHQVEPVLKQAKAKQKIHTLKQKKKQKKKTDESSAFIPQYCMIIPSLFKSIQSTAELKALNPAANGLSTKSSHCQNTTAEPF